MNEFKAPDGFCFVRNLSGGFFSRSALVHSRKGCPYVCKRVPKCILNDVRQFIERMDHISILMSPFIVPYCLIQEDEDEIILVRQYIDGVSLADNNVNIDKNLVFAMWKVVVRTFAHLHSHHITETFILPSNVFISNNTSIIITDTLPLSLKIDIKDRTPNLLQVGFLPPEVFDVSKQTVPRQSDAWSLGILLHYMMSHRLPWTSTNFCSMVQEILEGNAKIDASIPNDAQQIINQLIRVSPENRAEIDSFLDRFLADEDRISTSQSQTFTKESAERTKPVLIRPKLRRFPSITKHAPIATSNMTPKNVPPMNLSLRLQDAMEDGVTVLTVRSRSHPPLHLLTA